MSGVCVQHSPSPLTLTLTLTQPTYRGSHFPKIFTGFMCEAGDRQRNAEGSLNIGKEQVFSRVEQEANWRVPHLNPGILSLVDAKSSK